MIFTLWQQAFNFQAFFNKRSKHWQPIFVSTSGHLSPELQLDPLTPLGVMRSFLVAKSICGHPKSISGVTNHGAISPNLVACRVFRGKEVTFWKRNFVSRVTWQKCYIVLLAKVYVAIRSMPFDYAAVDASFGVIIMIISLSCTVNLFVSLRSVLQKWICRNRHSFHMCLMPRTHLDSRKNSAFTLVSEKVAI